MYDGLFVDDQEADCKFADILSTANVIQLTHIKPSKSITELADDIFGQRPDIVALDYRLDESPCGTEETEKPNRYKAGPLAQQLRDLILPDFLNDFPIILVSQEDNIQEFYKPDLTAHNLFDATFTKLEIINDADSAKQKVIGLINGYKNIIEHWKDDSNRIKRVLGSNALLASAQDIDAINQVNAPHHLARSIIQSIILRSGLLLDQAGLMAKLGIDENKSDINSLIKILQQDGIRYTGVFHEGWLRWWNDSTNEWASKHCNQPIENLGAKEITQRLSKKLGIQLDSATSRWQPREDNPKFSIACSSCNLPTELDFSVSAYDPITYGFIQKRIICWDCIAKGLYEEKQLIIDDSGAFIADKIENGEITKD